MANSVGKFGPYPAPYGATPAGGPVRGRLTARVQTGAGEFVRSRIALQVRLSVLSSGDRLPDAGAMAEELGMSEMTVRRTLETMCQDGLLDRRRGRAGGTFVSRDWDAVTLTCRDTEQATQIEDYHLLLECGLVTRGMGELPRGWSVGLRAMVDEMDASTDPVDLLRLETAFHLGLAGALGERVIGDQVADILGQLCLLAAPPTVSMLRGRNACHAALLSALDQGRLDAAVTALKEHRQAGAGEG